MQQHARELEHIGVVRLHGERQLDQQATLNHAVDALRLIGGGHDHGVEHVQGDAQNIIFCIPSLKGALW
jgi:formylmethanofuran dehydrogenase subunit C